MVVHCGQVNSCCCNDLAQRGGGVTLLPDEPFRSIENLFLGVGHSYDSIN